LSQLAKLPRSGDGTLVEPVPCELLRPLFPNCANITFSFNKALLLSPAHLLHPLPSFVRAIFASLDSAIAGEGPLPSHTS
jgi:hypothetical protein